RALESNDRGTPERRARFETKILAQCATIADATVRGHYISDMRRRLRELWHPAPPFSRNAGRRQRFPGQRPPGQRFPGQRFPGENDVSPELKAMVGAGLD